MAGIEVEHSRKGKLRAYWLGACVCMAGFLFGYDRYDFPAFETAGSMSDSASIVV